MLYRMQIVDFIPSGSWVIPKLIVTEDNLEAVRLARDLLSWGEPMHDRTGDDQARALLTQTGRYEAPLQTVARTRNQKTLSAREYRAVLDAAMGRAAL
jgi:hypothetical protein